MTRAVTVTKFREPAAVGHVVLLMFATWVNLFAEEEKSSRSSLKLKSKAGSRGNEVSPKGTNGNDPYPEAKNKNIEGFPVRCKSTTCDQS